jgi:hypothetical protein
MKKLNAKGFGVVEGLLIFVIIALIAGVSFYVYKTNKSTEETSNSTNSALSEDIDTGITKVDLELTVPADIEKLPPETPESFRVQLLKELKANTPTDGCVGVYMIHRISQANVQGGGSARSVDESDDKLEIEKCGSGAPFLWVLEPSGEWNQISLNGGATCKSEGGGLVYTEFAAQCYSGTNYETLIKNPNGSVTSISE